MLTPPTLRRLPLAPLVLLISCGVLAGCLPNRLVLDLAPGQKELQETTVIYDVRSDRGAKVVMIDVSGVLSQTPSPGLLASRANSVDSLVARLDKAERDPSVVGVVLRINSPGGTVAASESMYREVMRFREKTARPVVVSMAEIAASGGYYLSLSADHIVAQETTITGSIGVIIQTFNFSSGLTMLGIDARALTSGENKDLVNPFERQREPHYKIMQGLVDEFYASFRALVLEHRSGVPTERVDELTDGRVFTGKQALALGLVDENGGLREAFAAAKRLAGVPHARLVKYHIKGRDPGSAYANSRSPVGNDGGGMQMSVRVQSPSIPDSGFYYLWLAGL